MPVIVTTALDQLMMTMPKQAAGGTKVTQWGITPLTRCLHPGNNKLSLRETFATLAS
jgi:hypothetical protein